MNDEDGERLTDPRIFVGFQKRSGKLMSVTRDGGTQSREISVFEFHIHLTQFRGGQHRYRVVVDSRPITRRIES